MHGSYKINKSKPNESEIHNTPRKLDFRLLSAVVLPAVSKQLLSGITTLPQTRKRDFNFKAVKVNGTRVLFGCRFEAGRHNSTKCGTA
ncbi:hypothetical protein CEXT_216201 [Caerostris extrusa]|uniref:Uncharacterized protein n=1 Tax=Caerostris extrusa TaxID=172846 RepID=A0AAV4XYE9_CAEEX|nr:hypothetical protein CEXT_216201 [Caerostris extrusa]